MGFSGVERVQMQHELRIELANQVEAFFDYNFPEEIYVTLEEPLNDYWMIFLYSKKATYPLGIYLGNHDVLNHVGSIAVWLNNSDINCQNWNNISKELLSILFEFLGRGV